MATRLQINNTLRSSIETTLKPQMIESLKILSFPMLELETILKQEIIQNPLLEEIDPFEEEIFEHETEPETNEQESSSENEINNDNDISDTVSDIQELSDIIREWNEYNGDLVDKSEYANVEDEPVYDNFIAPESTLKLEFLSQFDKFHFQENEYFFIYDLVQMIDNYGFLPKDFLIYQLAGEYQISPQRADFLHQTIMTASPRGITAHNISESLYYQLEPYEQKGLIANIILHDFQDLLYGRYKLIASKYQVSEDEIWEIKERIGLLDPKPGLRINSGKPKYIVPDLIVTQIDNEYEVIINDFYIPKIQLNARYMNIIKESKQDREAVNYVRGKINSAKFIIRSIFMRNKTLEKVMRSIIKHQKNFFYHHSGILEPLNYATIANDIGVNESTISRVVKNKYADSRFGIICLKDFFCSNAAKDKNYDAVSKKSVHQQIQELIDKEDKNRPLSDQDVVDIFKERGISLSRRVITKYREALKIPNSRFRKK